MGRANVQLDPFILPPEKVAKMIEDCGFDVAVLSTEEQADKSSAPDGQTARVSMTNLLVEDMTCGAYTSAIESRLKRVK
ncbi:Copper-transporting ATPase [Penicillium lagena]|uniref:Copper-transporting ATPase n=1 Tax=Penicillium lagena TaxID=94218 RepID=UPI002540ECD6|nr:Copper-transporting ATPase [Penicillium lagena]KAJ5604344.1 Copper-transporting ATPase [Penicillium lagena]